MYQVSKASLADFDEIAAFLEQRGLAQNVAILQPMHPEMWAWEEWSVLLCRRGRQIAGVETVFDHRKSRRPSGWKPTSDYEGSMDCVDKWAVKALVAALPPGRGRFRLLRPVVQEYFDQLPGVERGDADFYFTVSPERFRPVAGEGVIELTAADGALFEGCERAALGDPLALVREGSGRKFAILRRGRVAASAGVGSMTPHTGTKREVIAISGVFTEPQYRRLGLGKRLVSHVTELILSDGNVPIYWTEPDNLPSQALARGLGYWQFGEMTTYFWRKR